MRGIPCHGCAGVPGVPAGVPMGLKLVGQTCPCLWAKLLERMRLNLERGTLKFRQIQYVGVFHLLTTKPSSATLT